MSAVAGRRPVQIPSKLEFVIDLKGHEYGIQIGPTLLARADEVIE